MTTRLPSLLILTCVLVAAPAHAALGTAVEFYNASINHYFLTAYPEEAAALDAGTNVKGWKRTGGQFTVFAEAADGLAAVCRFFGTPGVGPNSHFYTADPAECAKVKTLPAWTYEGIAFHIPLPTNGQCGGNWPVYRSYYSDNISDANHRFTVDLTAHVRMAKRRGDVSEGIVMCAPVTDEEREADVVRFLEQASLGPTEALVAEVKAKGIEKWLDEQLAMNITRYTQLPHFYSFAPGVVCIDDTTPPVTPEKFCVTNRKTQQPVAWEFYRQSRSAPDQVRVRMAYVWHLLFAMSGLNATYAMADFQQRLRDHAFGTFENIVARYTLSPQLGEFQTWVTNVPEADGVKPNENFARELMQLFTIGPNELGEDGVPRLDARGQYVPTYSQADIEVLARILTGYSYPPVPGTVAQFYPSESYYIGDMIPFDAFHDRGGKSLLGGRLVLPAGGTAADEVRAAIAMLVNHPNTPPFIVKQLIQKTVTSSPSPEYVRRIVGVFKDNGHGVRGDLTAVIRSILLDPEARGARKIDPEYGRMREPVLFMTALLRVLDITTDGVQPNDFTYGSNQFLFQPLTVFSYFPADYTLVGSSVPAPEFGIYGSSEFANRANIVSPLLWNDERPAPPPSIFDAFGPRPYVPNATGTRSATLAAFLDDAANVPALIARLDRLLLHGTMRPQMRSTLEIVVGKLPEAERLRRVRLAVDLVLTSVDYQVQK